LKLSLPDLLTRFVGLALYLKDLAIIETILDTALTQDMKDQVQTGDLTVGATQIE
jgi:hypothetical protein